MLQTSATTVNLSAPRSSAESQADQARAMTAQADAHADAGRWDDAVRAYRQAIALRPDDAGLHYSLGEALQGSRDLAAAEKAFRDSIALSPRNPAAYQGLGALYRAQGRTQEAVQAYRKCLEYAADPEQTDLVNAALERLLPGNEAVIRFYKRIGGWRLWLLLLGAWGIVFANTVWDRTWGIALVLLPILLIRTNVPAIPVVLAVLVGWPGLGALISIAAGRGALGLLNVALCTSVVAYLLYKFREYRRLDLPRRYQAGA